MEPKKKNIKGMNRSELRTFVESIGARSYRAEQLFRWMYAQKARSFEEMTDLSRSTRLRLEEIAELENLTCQAKEESSRDGTTKYLFRMRDGSLIESVLIPGEQSAANERPRLTLCVSTQVGCPLDCAFCATGTMGFLRNLTAGEIIDQVLQVQSMIAKRITNLVYMGMGEPMLNYDNVMKSVEILTDDHGMNVGWRHITISTAGYADHIRRMADENRPAKLALSLHSLNDEKRLRLMPINRKYPLSVLIDAVEYYYKKTRRRPTFEYILFDNFNDTKEDIRNLVALSRRIPSKINIIPFHSIEFTHPKGFGATLRPAPTAHVADFVRSLREENATVMVRSNAGDDIAAACGQLAVGEQPIRRNSSPSAQDAFVGIPQGSPV